MEMDTFIECVRNRPCLWNVFLVEYKDQDMKDSAWRDIVEECELKDKTEAKLIWKRLRDGHREALKRKKPSKTGQIPMNQKTWKYESQMEFLVPHMQIRVQDMSYSPSTPVNNIIVQATNADDTHSQMMTSEGIETAYAIHQASPEQQSSFIFEDEANGEYIPQETTLASEAHIIPVENRNKKMKKDELLLQYIQEREKRVKDNDNLKWELLQTMKKNEEPKSDLELFFLSMCKTTLALPLHLQLKIKRKLFEVVSEAEEENLVSKYNSDHYHS